MLRTAAEQAFDRLLIEAIHTNNLDSVRELLTAGATANAKNAWGYTPLHLTVSKEVAELLLDNGADPKATNINGFTPLHFARSKEIAELLLAKGADPKATNIDGFTPLHFANSKEIAELLLDNGADPKATTKDGETPLHRAKSKEIAELLLANGADVNRADNDGITPLHMAASQRDKDFVASLIAAGADINAKNNAGQTPLDVAILENGREVISEIKAAEYVDRVIDWYKDPSKLPGVVPPEFTSEHYDLLTGRMKSIFQRDGVPPKFFKMTGKNPDSAINKEVDGTPIIPPKIKDALQKFAIHEQPLSHNSPKYLANILSSLLPSLIQKEAAPDMPILYQDRETYVDGKALKATPEEYLKENAKQIAKLVKEPSSEETIRNIDSLQGDSLMLLYDEKEWKSKEDQLKAFNEFAGLKAAAGAGVSHEDLPPLDLTLKGLFNAISTGKNLPIIPHSEGALLGSFPGLLAEPQIYLSEHSLMAIHENIQNAKDGYYDKDTFANIQNLSRNISKIAKPMISDYERDHSPTSASEVAHALEAHSGAGAPAAAPGGAGRDETEPPHSDHSDSRGALGSTADQISASEFAQIV